jgi:signal peptidase I
VRFGAALGYPPAVLDHDDEGAARTANSASLPHSRSGWWWAAEWLSVIGIALVLAIGVRTYVIQTFYIPSGSMEPTLDIGDRILVFKMAYKFTSPATGDVVVFKAPPSEHCGDPSVTDLVKRIVGLPGQHISSNGNTILVNGRPLRQDWPHYADLITPITPQVIPPNHYFVMGDNHPASCDSRDWGTLPRSDIIGKVVLKIWPISQFGTI